MELRHLRYFVAVAEELHFARAARRLSMSQPPLSSQIRDLEREIGAALLLRTSRRVSLTPAGVAFLADARSLLASADNAVARARRVDRGEVGTVSAGFLGAAAASVLPDAVKALRRERPLLRIQLRELPSGPALLEALREDHIDLAVLRSPIDDDALATELLREDPFVAVLPRDHILTRQRQVKLADLLEQPFVLWERTSTPDVFDSIFEVGGRVGAPSNVIVESVGIQSVLGMVGAGLGVSLLPDSAAVLRHPNVVVRPLRRPAPSISLVAAWRRDDLPAPAAGLLDCIRDVCRTAL